MTSTTTWKSLAEQSARQHVARFFDQRLLVRDAAAQGVETVTFCSAIEHPKSQPTNQPTLSANRQKSMEGGRRDQVLLGRPTEHALDPVDLVVDIGSRPVLVDHGCPHIL